MRARSRGEDGPRAARRLFAALGSALVVGLVVLTGCAPAAPPQPRPQPSVVEVRDDVATAKSAVPAPTPLPDLSTLTTIDPKHVVAGLPGLAGLTQLASEDRDLGRWRTAVVGRDTAAYDAPMGTPVGAMPAETLGVRTVVPVVDARDGWLRVMVAARGALPSQDVSRVNARTAWIRERDTIPAGTSWRIRVDTEAQTMTVDDGDTVTTYSVLATGAPRSPTPADPQFVVGTFWDQPGTVTPRVILLSSQSETMDAYDTRTGTSATALHTTTVASRGEVSNGCVRLSDEVLDVLWRRVPAGTLVLVD